MIGVNVNCHIRNIIIAVDLKSSLTKRTWQFGQFITLFISENGIDFEHFGQDTFFLSSRKG